MDRGSFTIRVIDKLTDTLFWTEHHSTKERAAAELKHMKENHFNPKFFEFEVIGGEISGSRHQ